MTCRSCSREVVPQPLWRRLSAEERVGRTLHRGRRLCTTCWDRAARNGTLEDVPLQVRRRAELLEDVEFLIETGVRQPDQIAERLHVSRDALTLALRRAARAGDERAARIRSMVPWTRTAA